MKLAELQGLFWRAMRQDPMPAEVSDHFLGHGALSAAARLKIYQDGYWFRQVDALFDCFPKLAAALGAERFTRVICRYLAERPSGHPVLELLGEGLEDFLERDEDPELRRLADLAALEHARLLVLLAPRPTALATVADIDPDTFAESRLDPSPALRFLRLRGDAIDRWHAPEAPERPAPTPVAVWRKGFTVRHQPLDEDEGNALDLLLQGAPIAVAFDAFSSHPSPETRAFQALSAWLQRHWFCAFLPPTP